MIYIDEESCTGCGLCLDACPQSAIELIENIATIKAGLCNECLACVEVCPNGAVLSLEEPVSAVQPTVVAVARPSAPTVTMRSTALLRKRVLPVAGTALAFVGRKVVPYVADVVMEALERRTNRPDAPGIQRAASPSRPTRVVSERSGKGKRQRQRQRGRGRE